MAQHSELSGSSAYRWIRCPGSIPLTRKIQQQQEAEGRIQATSPAARDGIMAHAVCEHILQGNTVEPDQIFVFEDHGEHVTATVTAEMLEHVDVYVQHVRLHAKTADEVLLEQHVSLARLVRDGMFGTADNIILYNKKKHLIVGDFKYGYTPVHMFDDAADPNPQLMYYAAGALDMFEWKHDTVTLEIIQPRCMEVEPIQSHTMEAWEVRHWAENELWQAVHLATSKDPPLVPGDHCRFCPALNVCPAMRQVVQNAAGEDFTGIVKMPVVPDSLHELSEVLMWAPMIDAWLRQCEETALAHLRAGKKIPGFKLVRKRSNREWPTENPQLLASTLNLHLPKSRQLRDVTPLLKEPKLKSPAQLEKLVGKAVVNKVAVRPEGDVTVAFESDHRDALGPVSDFKALDELNDLM